MARGWLSERLFADARERVAAGDAAAQAACGELLAAADQALPLDALSVRDNGGSPHFRQDAVYVPGQDGVFNAESNRESGNLQSTFGVRASNLALAYRFTGETRYADKALELIHAWCIDENTRMYPEGIMHDPATPGLQHGGDIILFGTLPRAFYAMALLSDYPGWDLACHAAVRHWVRGMVTPQRRRMFFQGGEMTNNWEDARLAYLAFAAAALDNLDLLLEVFDRWKMILPLKMTDRGELPRETMRTRSMTYTLAALRSMSVVAELAAGYGCDLYNYSANGRCLKLAIDYAAAYLLDIESWPFTQLDALDGTHLRGALLCTFELAHRQWGEPRYIDVIERWGGRPVTDHHATLLHARA